jgi:hypothetical protein
MPQFLIEQLQLGAVDGSASITDLLRKCAQHATSVILALVIRPSPVLYGA